VETASNAAARLTGFFFIKKYDLDNSETVGATIGRPQKEYIR